MKFGSRIGVVTVLAVCALMCLWCCGNTEDGGEISVTLPKEVVGTAKGNMFVKVVCPGDWTLALVSDAGEVDWAELSSTSGSGNVNSVRISWQENTGWKERSLRIVLDDGRRWSQCSLTQQAVQDEDDPAGPGDDDNQPGDGGDDDLVQTGWMELPAMDDPDLGYYSHSFKYSGKTYRNYTFGWNQKEYVAHWVAYPLCGFYTTKTVQRTDEWAYDPKLGKGASSAPFGGYGGDYARGHQIPSADRLCCRDANIQTFYGTNITPQLNQHNEGIWSRMEDKIRTIANNSDTTYVITGCIVESNGKKTTDSDGNRLGVPKAYYKAILRYSKASTQGAWRAAAFYTEHKDYGSASINDVVVSVDYLEQLTGMDFFVNLPAKVGESQAASLEASTAVWW